MAPPRSYTALSATAPTTHRKHQARASARCVGKFQAAHLSIVPPRGEFAHAVVGLRGTFGACTGVMALRRHLRSGWWSTLPVSLDTTLLRSNLHPFAIYSIITLSTTPSLVPMPESYSITPEQTLFAWNRANSRLERSFSPTRDPLRLILGSF